MAIRKIPLWADGVWGEPVRGAATSLGLLLMGPVVLGTSIWTVNMVSLNLETSCSL